MKLKALASSRSIQAGVPVPTSLWPARYQHAKNGKYYAPHHELERDVVQSDLPRYFLIKGGEGSGKSVAGIIKDLERLRRGCDGIMVSPDLPHFRKSLWPEFQNWCPKQVVVKEERYKLETTWAPQQSFELHFHNECGTISKLYCGGIEDPTGWHGPNVNFAHLDEAHRHPSADALKTIDGRLRIPGVQDVPPAVWLTSTPKKNWLYDFFGDVDTGTYLDTDPMKPFKDEARLITLRTKDNEIHTVAGFADRRRLTLSEKEARVYLDAEWEDMADTHPFIPDMRWWDACKDEEPPQVSVHNPLVVALDAGVRHDSFGLVAVSAHPRKSGCMIVQAAREWSPLEKGSQYLDDTGALDFRKIREEIQSMIRDWNVIKIVYDKTELHLMAQDLSDIVMVEEFSQQTARLVADKGLLDLIMERRIWHRGEPEMRNHLFNADAKVIEDKGIRIVKREANKKIDLAVCLSMACAGIIEYIPNVDGYVAMGTNAQHGTVFEQILECIG